MYLTPSRTSFANTLYQHWRLKDLNCVQVTFGSPCTQFLDPPRRLVQGDGGLPLPETDLFHTHGATYMQ